jgi:hypothetical protein
LMMWPLSHPAFSVRSKPMLLHGTEKKKPQKRRLVPPKDIPLKLFSPVPSVCATPYHSYLRWSHQQSFQTPAFSAMADLPNTAIGSGRVPLAPAYMGRKRILPMLSLHAQGLLLLAAVFLPNSKSVGRAAPVFFGPRTPVRTWGTRPGKRASFFAPTTATPMNSTRVLSSKNFLSFSPP